MNEKKKESDIHVCYICGQGIYPEDEQEYIKTKRGTEIWIHEKCYIGGIRHGSN